MGFKIEKRTPPPSTTSPCAHLKAAYNDCFNRWYSEKFLKGQWDKVECVTEWQKYRECLSQHLEDKHLSRFLEVGGGVGDEIPASVSNDQFDPKAAKHDAFKGKTN